MQSTVNMEDEFCLENYWSIAYPGALIAGQLTSIDSSSFHGLFKSDLKQRNCTVLNKLQESCSFIDGSTWYGDQARSRDSSDPMDYVGCGNLYVIMKLLGVRFQWPMKGKCFVCTYTYVVQCNKEQAKSCRIQAGSRDISTVLCIWDSGSIAWW